MRIQHNIAALNSYRQLGTNNNAVSKNLEKLSSGYRINRAGDDAAGLAISEKMRAQITGLETAQKNALDGISLVQTAEGALTEVHSMLNRMTELATQSANGTYSSEVDRENLQKEVATLKDEIDRISKSTNFNGIKLLDGSIGDASGVNFGEAAGQAGQSLDVGSLITTGSINDGKLIPGHNGQAAEVNVYLSEEIQLTNASTTAATKVDFTLDIGGASIKVELSSDTKSVNGTTKFKMEDIVDTIMSGVATNGTVTAPAGGAALISITMTASATAAANETQGWVQSFEELKEKYTVSYADSRLTIKANKVGATSTNGWEANAAITSTFKPTAGKFTTNDIKAMQDNLLQDLTGSTGAATSVKLGEVGYKVVGEDANPPKYELASAKFTIGNAADLNNKIFEFEGVKFMLQDISQKDDWLETKDIPDGVEIIKYDSSATATTQSMNIANAMATALDSKFDSKFDFTITGANEITIRESIEYGNKVLAADDKDMITNMNTVLNTTPGITLGGSNGSTTIELSKDLEAGSWIEVNGKKYQFANSSSEVMSGSTFVKFTEGDTAANVAALQQALSKDFPNATVTGNKIDLGKNVSVDAGSKGLSLQVGDTSDSYQKVTVNVKKMDTESLDIADVDISTVEGAEVAIGQLRDAINKVSSTRGDLGAVQNRLEHTINNLGVTTENITAAESRIRDTDMAEEMMAYTKNNILVQAAQAMLAQANTVPQGVLQLLG